MKKEKKPHPFAKPRHAGPTKREKRLAARIKDFEGIDTSKKSGYHRPGSLQ